MTNLAVFLQDLFIPKERAQALLAGSREPVEVLWPGDPVNPDLSARVRFLITSKHEVDAEVLEPWPNLEMVSLAFTGYNRVDLDYCRARGLALYYVPDYSGDSVAELAVGLTLAVARKVMEGDESTRAGKWDQHDRLHGLELHGRQVGILGTGTIGTKTARIFKAMGCHVVGWSRTRRQSFLDLGCRYEEDLGTLFSESDVIVLHLPVDASTRRIVGAELLSRMKPTSILVNVARADLVDTSALVERLATRRILGAAIDVFDEEPPPTTSPLLALNNVVVTPHLGFKTKEALDRLAQITIENVKRFLNGDDENRLKYNDS